MGNIVMPPPGLARSGSVLGGHWDQICDQSDQQGPQEGAHPLLGGTGAGKEPGEVFREGAGRRAGHSAEVKRSFERYDTS